MKPFTRHRKGVRVTLDRIEATVLRECGTDLLQLIEPAKAPTDPLAALVGMPDGDVAEPDDPVLQRLLPAAYRDDDEAAGDFRRYTDADLRAGKRANATLLLSTLPEGGGTIDLDRDQVDAWLSSLNDIRLALGTALDVTEDTDPQDLGGDDPRYQALNIYGWLGFLQDSLLSCIDPRKT